MPPADPAALGAALARLVADPALRQRLGAAARAFVLPRFGVDGYVESRDRVSTIGCSRRRGARVKLGIVYHMPFWQAADGTLWEVEGSFARYVDSLAPYFDEISLCVPVLDAPRGEGTRVRATNVTLAPLPYFRRPGAVLSAGCRRSAAHLSRWVRGVDVLHCRVPTPAAIFAFAFARLLGRPRVPAGRRRLQALLPTLPYRGVKQMLWRAYIAFEEWTCSGWPTRADVCQRRGARARSTAAGRPVIETHDDDDQRERHCDARRTPASGGPSAS